MKDLLNCKYRPNRALVVECAENSLNVYDDDWCKKQYGLFIDNKETDTQVVCRNIDDEMVHVIFRGTSSGKDVLTDLKAWKVKGEFSRGVHAGFLKAFQSVWGDLLVYVAKFNKVVVTGHSLAGALSQLFASHTIGMFKDCQVICFASPLVGDSGFVKRIEESDTKIILLEHYLDKVTWLPTRAMGYRKYDNSVNYWRWNITSLGQHRMNGYIETIKKKY